MKYRKLRKTAANARDAGVDFIYVCGLLDSLQRVRSILHENRTLGDDLKDLNKVENSLITILEYVGAGFVLDDWEQVKRGKA